MELEHVVVCPGTFDPITNGHLHIIRRAAKLFGRVIVSVHSDTDKDAMFTTEERVEMVREACAHLPNVEVVCFSGLVVAHARGCGALALVKGLRAVSDFEAEFEMSLTNRQLEPDIQTVFMMTDAEHAFLRSTRVKELARLGADVSPFVPPAVVKRLEAKVAAAGALDTAGE
ncbi:MAG: pantetheine-phosphate adenylyltransferase [Armatimonadota bacterium]|jgi:pantetheine-phosphate adenylyltransferase